MSAPTKQQIDETVDAWFAKNFNNSVLSRSTDVYNAAYAARDELKTDLIALCGQQQPTGEQHGDSA